MIKKISRESIEQVRADLETLLNKPDIATEESSAKQQLLATKGFHQAKYRNISFQRTGQSCWAEYVSSTKTLTPITETCFEGHFIKVKCNGDTPKGGQGYTLYLASEGEIYCFSWVISKHYKLTRLAKFHHQLTSLTPGQLVAIWVAPMGNGVKCSVLVDGEALEWDEVHYSDDDGDGWLHTQA